MLTGFGRAERKQIVTGLSNCGTKVNCLECPLLSDKPDKGLNIRGRTKAQPLSIVLYPESANSSSAGC
jgi:hypothetical protein